MEKQQVLIVEDDAHLAQLIQYNLEKSGFKSVLADTGEKALEVLKNHIPDLILLDVMLPKMDGLEVCRALKQEEKLKRIPIVMLTAKGEEVDRIVGLELGADDYVVKPFSPRELMLRIKAILRRGSNSTPEFKKDILKAGPVEIDLPKHQVHAFKKEIVLTSLEFKLLMTLVHRRGRVQTRDRLLSDVWEIQVEIDTRTIDTHVKRLREKLGKAGDWIETVRGLGYRFKEKDV